MTFKQEIIEKSGKTTGEKDNVSIRRSKRARSQVKFYHPPTWMNPTKRVKLNPSTETVKESEELSSFEQSSEDVAKKSVQDSKNTSEREDLLTTEEVNDIFKAWQAFHGPKDLMVAWMSKWLADHDFRVPCASQMGHWIKRFEEVGGLPEKVKVDIEKINSVRKLAAAKLSRFMTSRASNEPLRIDDEDIATIDDQDEYIATIRSYKLLDKKLRDLRVEEAIFDWLDEGKREIGEDLVREISEKFDINLELVVSLCFRYIGFDTPRTPLRERRRKYESGLFYLRKEHQRHSMSNEEDSDECGRLSIKILDEMLGDLKKEEAVYMWLDKRSRKFDIKLVRQIATKFKIEFALALKFCIRYIGWLTPRTPLREKKRKLEEIQFNLRNEGAQNEARDSSDPFSTSGAQNCFHDLQKTSEISKSEDSDPIVEVQNPSEKKSVQIVTMSEDGMAESEPSATEMTTVETKPCIIDMTSPESKPSAEEKTRPKAKPTVTERPKPKPKLYEPESAYDGVMWCRATRKWRAHLRNKQLGLFLDDREAALAVNRECMRLGFRLRNPDLHDTSDDDLWLPDMDVAKTQNDFKRKPDSKKVEEVLKSNLVIETRSKKKTKKRKKMDRREEGTIDVGDLPFLRENVAKRPEWNFVRIMDSNFQDEKMRILVQWTCSSGDMRTWEDRTSFEEKLEMKI